MHVLSLGEMRSPISRAHGSRAAVLGDLASRHAFSSANERGRQRHQGAILASGASNQTLREQLSEKLREQLSKELRDVFVVQLGDKGTQLGPEF